MYNVGIDLIEINRIKKSLRNSRFLKRVFSEEEISLFRSRNYNVNSISANFCAKEALSKALGTGISKLGLSNISILRDKETGAPFFKFDKKIYNIVKDLSFSVSLSHTKSIASAVVLVYKNN